MGKLLNRLTGHAGKVKPDWVGEVHDARCRFEEIGFDSGETGIEDGFRRSGHRNDWGGKSTTWQLDRAESWAGVFVLDRNPLNSVMI
jgi:hypothetical protein